MIKFLLYIYFTTKFSDYSSTYKIKPLKKLNMKKTIKSLILLAAVLLLNSFCVHAQSWNLVGNTNLTATSKLGGTSATAAQNFPLQLWTYNAERIHINANVASKVGFVGIGTAAPNTRLHVNGVITATGGTSTTWNTAVTRVPAGTTNKVPRWSGTAYVAGTIFDNATNVGIGVSPLAPLDVLSKGNYDLFSTLGDVRIGNSTRSLRLGIALTGGGAGDAYIASVGGTSRLFLGSGTSFAGTQTMAITNGAVGIGTVSPSYKLHVADATSAAIVAIDGAAASSVWTYYQITGGFKCASGYRASSDAYTIFAAGGDRINVSNASGFVGINTTAPAYQLDVCGVIRGKEVRVATGWCDYVFAEDYKLAPLSEVEAFINENKHLPEVTPGSIIEAQGLEVGKVSAEMIKKIEELTLYVIEQDKQIKNLQSQVNSLVEKGGK